MRLIEDTDRLREAICQEVGIEEVARARLPNSEPFGEGWLTAPCPWCGHEEFYVFYSRPPGSYQCAECGRGGDVVDLEFASGDYGEIQEALIALANQYGVELPWESNGRAHAEDVLRRLGSGEESPNGSAPKEKEERRNQADRLIGYALKDASALFTDQHGEPHALVDGEPVPLNSRCYSWLRRLMWQEEQRVVNGEYLKTAAGTLAAHAEFSGDVRELHTRAAWHEGTLYYELRTGCVVRVDAGGWSFESNPPVFFRHFANLKPLPDPEAGGDVGELAGYANLKTNRDKRLFTTYAVTLALPHVGRPMLTASGAMGSGKTTSQRLLKRTVDPTAPETVRFDPRDFLQKASHAYVLMLDNQNTVPEWAADTLCRLVTGEADSKRRLYTDDEDVIIELRRAVLLNGINVPTDRGDVLDRSLVVELERIPDRERRTEEELWERFEKEHPKLLGALFDVLSEAIARKQSIKLSRRPRLADWGEYAASVYEVMGWGAEQFLEDWDEVVKVQNQATLDGSPVAQAVSSSWRTRRNTPARPQSFTTSSRAWPSLWVFPSSGIRRGPRAPGGCGGASRRCCRSWWRRA